jgi:glycosyltransferase involved in cell wall biosynthesis
MTPTAKITVGIPTYNRASWLKDSIASVLAQTRTDFRLIVSDNKSDDNTSEVVGSFDDDRIDYIRSEENIGAIGNMNRLIGRADTEFLVILPDDDILYPGYLEAATELMESHPTVGLGHSAFDVIDAQSRVVREIQPVRANGPVAVEKSYLALERLMLSTWPICFSSVIYRTEAILAAGAFHEGDEAFGDLRLWMRIAADWDFGYIATPLTGFRVHSESLTTSLEPARGTADADRELKLAFAKGRFERRASFLEGATLEPHLARWLRSLAAVELLAEQGDVAPPWPKAFMRAARIAVVSPGIIRRRVFWLVVLRVEFFRLIGLRVRARLRALFGPVKV